MGVIGYKKVVSKLEKGELSHKTLSYVLDMLIAIRDESIDTEIEYKEYVIEKAKFVRKQSLLLIKEDSRCGDLYYKALLFLAPYDFDSYLLYVEKNRSPKKRFYQPRRKTLKVIVDDLQDLEDRKIEFLGVSLPPRVGKSTVCIFFLTWIMGKRPNSHSGMSGHSGFLADGFYKEVLNIITNEEYCYSDIFPDVQLESKSAEQMTVNLDEKDRFKTLTCRGIDGTWTGAVDISNDGYLYVDDLVRDRTESLSPIRLENRYQDYLNVLVDRKNDGSRELMVGTRWNVLDPLGKIQAEKEGNPKYRFRVIPALDKNGESNFKYKYGLGFSTEYYNDIKSRLDKNEWMAKYQGKPFVREGLSFPADTLKYYNGVLPEGEHTKVAVCDVAWGGGDSLSMPFAYIFGEDVYIHDVIFNKGDKKVTKPIVISKTKEHMPYRERFEANNGGDEYADDIDRQLREDGIHINISHKKAPTNVSKIARIVQYAPDIKNFYFLDEKHRTEGYNAFMDELNMFTKLGKNEHDDAPDSLAQLCDFIYNGISQTTIMSRRKLGL